MAAIDPGRVVADLRELKGLTGDDDGAQRVAWTDTWKAANDWFLKELDAIDGVTVDSDAAGNIWATAPGDSERFVIIGGHLDSVPNGGWLDGILNVLAGLEVLRAQAPESRPLTLKLVSWADEEGARFGRSLLGSSAAAGTLEPDAVRGLTDRDGTALPDALREHGVDLDSALDARSALEGAAAYLELHIEQGPVLESIDKPLGAVLGTFGVERHAVRFTGVHAHAGSTPMEVRRDAFLAAARSALAWRDDAASRDDVRATTGIVKVSPGIVTAFNGMCEVSLDQRALDAAVLADMLDKAKEASRADRGRGGLRGQLGAHLADRADPVQRRSRRHGRRRDRGGRRHVASAAERTAARRRRDGARHPHRDALRQEPARPEPHQGGGHPRGGPGAVGTGPGRAHPQSARVGGLSMDFGVTFQTDPPASRVVELTQRAEGLGFDYAWTFDSHILWQEPYVIYSQMLAATDKIVVGPFVTNPATRDPTVTGSLFATLNDMFGNRTICGIGRGDSSRRVLGRKPTTLAETEEAMHVIKELAEGRAIQTPAGEVRIPWVRDGHLDVWMAAYGPKALALCGRKADGFILQLADPDITRWTVGKVREAAAEAGRDPDSIAVCVAAPAYVGDDIDHAREQCRWFGGMVGNHVADIVKRYGEGGDIPRALTDYIKAREGYDYSHHGRVGNPDTEFVPDEIVERFCVLGTVDDHIAKLRELEGLGVDQFNIYLMHDAMDATLDAYGSDVIPAMATRS